MRKSILVIALIAASTAAFAQSKVMVTSNPNAVQIQGNTQINANAQNVNAVAVGKGNTAKNAVGAIKGGTQIQGNTKINANAKNVNAVAVGKGNTATNDVGVIGGK
ncbi:MAG: hypothetical protein A2040_02670 [Rhodocyclales bacterium GWA2_65_19]|nr:MAG: hypothetical protein A2040_02670 [Rhodocyclales bacterium GWA2_65_19]